MEPLLKVDDLAVSYSTKGHDGFPVLRGVGFQINPGEAVGLLGESGCGKSTLALSLLQLLPPGGSVLRGAIVFRGMDLLSLSERRLQRIRGAEISMIYQEPTMALNPVMRVGDQVAEVLRAHRATTRKNAKAEARALLAQVGLAVERGIDGAYPHQLSGGQRQRVVIAQAIACKPALVIADEPTSALDAVTQIEILSVLKDLREKFRLALILISHHPGELARMVERILVVYAGRIVEEGPAQQVLHRPLHPYTRGLMNSGLSGGIMERHKLPLPVIAGDPPDMSDLPRGCSFEPRCPERMEICRSREPEEFQPENGRRVACFKYGS
jgi:oligopeptide/dipeptide ABC transporter ATP-binding protein